MIAVSEAEKIHQQLIDQFGGAAGTRDAGALASAMSRPYQTFDGQELYSGVIEKAAALIESILMNHPFIDSNKRTGYVLMRLILMEYGFDIIASQDEKYDFVISIAADRWIMIRLNAGFKSIYRPFRDFHLQVIHKGITCEPGICCR